LGYVQQRWPRRSILPMPLVWNESDTQGPRRDRTSGRRAVPNEPSELLRLGRKRLTQSTPQTARRPGAILRRLPAKASTIRYVIGSRPTDNLRRPSPADKTTEKNSSANSNHRLDFHLFEDQWLVNPPFVVGWWGLLSSLRRLAAQLVGRSCPGFSIRSRAVRRPDESGSLPGQDHGRGACCWA
jgi:hypothetical protein